MEFHRGTPFDWAIQSINAGERCQVKKYEGNDWRSPAHAMAQFAAVRPGRGFAGSEKLRSVGRKQVISRTEFVGQVYACSHPINTNQQAI
jgi:hypothetical protein